MKKLILIQNDYPSTGKSTLARCFSRYLRQFGVAHQVLSLVEEPQDDAPETVLDGSSLTPRRLLGLVEESSLTILEVATGMGEFFNKFYQTHDLNSVLGAKGIALSVVLPVTGESDSFDAVLDAAETYSDHAEYLIAQLITSSYDDDEKVWDTSYAARVMDMFEAVELHIPEVGFAVELELRTRHQDLAEALLDPDAESHYGRDFVKWEQRVMGQVESARQYLFGDAFKPTVIHRVEKKTRGRARAA